MHRKWRNKNNIRFKQLHDLSPDQRKWIHLGLSEKEFLKCIAVGFILVPLTRKPSLREALDDIKRLYPDIDFGKAGCRDILSAMRARVGEIGSDWFCEDMQENIQAFLYPGSRGVIDESLPLCKHKEPLQGKRELVKIPRKPSNIGFLIYMLLCCFIYSRLPIMFALVINRYNDRVTPCQAFMRLLRVRYLHGKGCPISIVADSAFSKRDLRAVVGTHGVFTDGIVADITMSMNVKWDQQLWKAMAGNLNPWQFRVYYSQKNEATVCVIRVKTRGEIYTLFRWTNAYTYPCAPLPPPDPQEPPNVSDAGLTVHTAEVLLSLPVEQLRMLAFTQGTISNSTSPYALVKAITGIDVFAHQSHMLRISTFPEDENVTMPGGKVVLVSVLQRMNMKYLKELCTRHHLLSPGSHLLISIDCIYNPL